MQKAKHYSSFFIPRASPIALGSLNSNTLNKIRNGRKVKKQILIDENFGNWQMEIVLANVNISRIPKKR
jgi:hypothetical protein